MARAYRRDSSGRFAGGGAGTTVTYGKAGGFANKAFATRVASQRASAGASLGATVGTKGSNKSRTASRVRAVGRAAAGGAVVGLGYRAVGVSGGRSALAGAAYVALKAVSSSKGSARPTNPKGKKVK